MNLEVVETQVENTSLISVEETRAIQEVQAMCTIAKRFPRDLTSCYTAIMKELDRPSLAKVCIYSYPRGGQAVSGASIRLLEVVARNFKNLQSGIKELTRLEGSSICEAYCWDMESNIKKTLTFTVKHIRDKKGGGVKLTDERDIYEIIANYGTRRMRNCIQAMIPADIMEDALEKVRKVIAAGDKSESLKDRIQRILLAFDALGVTQQMLETYLKHPIAQTIPDEFVELQGIYNALKDKSAKREDYFVFETADKTTPQDVTDKNVKEQLEKQRHDMFIKVEEKIRNKIAAGGDPVEIEKTIGMALGDVQNLKTDQLVALWGVLK